MNVIKAKQEVLKAGNELVALGLVARTWGNVSCRIDDETFAVTPSGIGYDRLDENSIVIVNMNTLEYKGSVKPSSEKGIHAAAYNVDPNINFVIHTHQTYATCVSVSGFSKLEPDTDEVAFLGGEIGSGSYAMSGTKKLTEIISTEMARGKHAILMANHGAVLAGTNKDEAFKRASVLENICYRIMSDLPDFDDSPTEPDSKAQNIISAITGENHSFKKIMILSSDTIKTAMSKVNVLPAIIDDFAQMVGNNMKTALPEEAVKKLRGRNAVYVKDIGALCCAKDESDCRAILTLVEKNALAFLNGSKNGDFHQLPFLNKKLMRHIYLKNYSKKK